MFATAWRLRRATTIETALIDLEVVTEEPKLKARFDTVDGGILLASAFRSLADESRSLALVLRYEARLRRIHQQNYDMLLRLRQQRQSEPAPPEPPPVPAPTPPPARVVQADSLPETKTKGLQNEPAAQHRHRSLPKPHRAKNLQRLKSRPQSNRGPYAMQINCHSFLKKVFEIPGDKALE